MKYIDHGFLLDEVCRAVAASPWAAVDTEADSLHRFTEKLCLLQISTDCEDYIVDPLVVSDLRVLTEQLSRRPLIFHGADFDVRILKRAYPFSPVKMFDTLLAAQLLGYEKQGLAELASRHCQVMLSKVHQKADWSKRPLDEKQLEYAANDTRYLFSIKSAMEKELAEKGRLSWHEQNCERLLKNLELAMQQEQKEALAGESETAWQIKGSRKLKGRGLTVLKALWQWRQEEARLLDRPAFKVLNPEYLVQIAEWCQHHPQKDISEWGDAPRNVRGRYQEDIRRVIARARLMPESAYIDKRPKMIKRKWSAQQHKRYLALKEKRAELAEQLKNSGVPYSLQSRSGGIGHPGSG